jgi:hypothetical protein
MLRSAPSQVKKETLKARGGSKIFRTIFCVEGPHIGKMKYPLAGHSYKTVQFLTRYSFTTLLVMKETAFNILGKLAIS